MHVKKVTKATIVALQRGSYTGPHGNTVHLPKVEVECARTIRATIVAQPKDCASSLCQRTDILARTIIFHGDSFDASQHLLSVENSAGATVSPPPLVLDFASDSTPGGGYRSGQIGTQVVFIIQSTRIRADGMFVSGCI